MQPSNHGNLEALAQRLICARQYERAIDVRTAKNSLEALQAQVNEIQNMEAQAVASKDYAAAGQHHGELVKIQAQLNEEADRVKADFASELSATHHSARAFEHIDLK